MTNLNFETKSGVLSLNNPVKLPYKKILDAMAESAAVLSIEVEVLYANPAFCTRFDQPTQCAVLGEKLTNIFLEKYSNDLLALLKLANTHSVSHELEFIRKNGQLTLVKLSISPIFNKEVVVGFIVLVVNVSENNKSNELLESERFRLAQAQRVAKIGSWEAELPACQLNGQKKLTEFLKQTHPTLRLHTIPF